MNKLKVIELFAGIGAQRQALKEAGINHEVVAISEVDKYALKAYELLHGDAPNLGDIRKIEKLPIADMWTYSFPCTDISLAGRLGGFEKGSNTNSSLLWEVQRLLIESSKAGNLPKYLILENVKNLVSKKFMPLFQVWIDFLSSLGYKNYWKVLNAKDYGIPQNRERVFMVSMLDENVTYQFPEPIPLTLKLANMLEKDVEEKYFLSKKLIECFCSMKNRNGLIKGLQFRPHDFSSRIAWTILTCPGSRPADNYIVYPIIAASIGRKDENGDYMQQLEFDGEVSNALTTVQKDNFVIVPQATKSGYAIAEHGDGVYTNRCKSKRGVEQKNKIPTLKGLVSDLGVIVEKDEWISYFLLAVVCQLESHI